MQREDYAAACDASFRRASEAAIYQHNHVGGAAQAPVGERFTASGAPFNGFHTVNGSTPFAARTTESYQEAMEGLNKAFFEFIVGQARENPRSNWSAAVQDYVKHADEIAIKHASTKPLSLFEQAQLASPIYSHEAMSRPSAAGFSDGFGFASIRSGGIGEASSSASQPTAPGYAFAPVSAAQAPKGAGVIAGPSSDYNLFRDFGGERSSTLFNPPEIAFN